MSQEEKKPEALTEEMNQAAIDELGEAIAKAITHADINDVLALLTGTFVGITLEIVRREGKDPSKAILVDGGDSRDITIHAAKV